MTQAELISARMTDTPIAELYGIVSARDTEGLSQWLIKYMHSFNITVPEKSEFTASSWGPGNYLTLSRDHVRHTHTYSFMGMGPGPL